MLDILLGLWQFFVVFSVGWAIERRVTADLPYGYRVAVAFGLGETAISGFLFLLGVFGGLRGWVLVPLALAATILFGPRCVKELRRMAAAARPHLLRAPATSVVVAALLGVYALGSGVPEREFDALWYHLATPFHYITGGGAIRPLPFNLPSHYQMNGQIHYAFSLLVGNDLTAKAFAVAHFLPMLVLLWSVIKRYGTPGWGLLGVAVYLSSVQFRLPVMANAQRVVYFYVFLSWVLLWEAVERDNGKAMILSAVFCGMAMGAKANAILYGYAGQVIFLLGWTVLRPRNRFRQGVKRLLVLTGVGWLVFLPWLVKAWVFTGDPMFPMFSGLFPVHPDLAYAARKINAIQGISLLKCGSLSGVAANLLRHVRAFLYGSDIVFPVGVLAVLAAALIRPREWRFPAVSAAISYLLLVLYWGADVGRLFGATYGVVVTVIVLSAAALADCGAAKTRLARLVYPLLLFGFVLTFAQYHWLRLSRERTRWAGEICPTRRSQEEWLVRRGVISPAYLRMKRYVAEHVPADETIFGYGTSSLFHMEHRNIRIGEYFRDPIEEWLRRSPEYAIRRLRGLGVRWFLWNRRVVDTGPSDEGSRFREMLDQGFVEEYRTGDLVLHRLKPEPGPGPG